MPSDRGHNLTHPKVGFLPDAPDVVTAHSESSPYHESTSTPEQSLQVEKAIRVMAVACVRDHPPMRERNLDFTARSIGDLDGILSPVNMTTYSQEDTIVYVAELGAYMGVVMELEHGGSWHTSPKYYFSALRFETKSRGVVEISPFALITKRLVDKNKEPPLLQKYQFIARILQE